MSHPTGTIPTTSEPPFTRVEVHHEYGTLKEVMVGSQPRDTFTTVPYESSFDSWMKPRLARLCKEHPGKRVLDVDPAWAIAVEEQLENLARMLEARGVKVHRGCRLEGEDVHFSNPAGGWSTWFVRDPTLVIGNNIIETAPRDSWRFRERFAVRPTIKRIMENTNARWVAMPFPSPRQSPDDPRLEGGDVLLNGREIYVGVIKGGEAWATTPNGIRWLQHYLGREYRVFQFNSRAPHLDGVLALLHPGLALCCLESEIELQGAVRDWELIDVTLEEARNLGCNCLILDQQTVMMDTRPIERVAKEVEKRGIEVIHIDFDAITDTVGGLRCSTHPIYRESKLEGSA